MKKATTISKRLLKFGVITTVTCVLAILTAFFMLAMYIASDICSDMLESGVSYAKNTLNSNKAYNIVADGKVVDMDTYELTLEELNTIRYSTGSISHLMVFEPKENYLRYIFDTDTDAGHSGIGDIYEYDSFYNSIRDKLLNNESIISYLAFREGGELTVSSFSPIYDPNGVFYSYIEMDISVSMIMNKLAPILTIALVVVFVAAALAIYALGKRVRKSIGDNLTKITQYTDNYRKGIENGGKRVKPETPCINTNDEMERLFKSIRAMTESMDEYVDRQKESKWNAEHDELTTLFNRSKLFSRAERYYPKMNSLFVVAVSINNLKEMNARYSLKSGDSVLVKVAKEMRTIMSDSIHPYRVGSDEFVIVMCNFEREAAESFINDWVKDMGRLNRASDEVCCTLSVGCAFSDSEPLDFDKLLETASCDMLSRKG